MLSAFPSLRNLSDEKQIELAALLPDIQVPGFRATQLAAIDAFEQTYAAALDANDKNQERFTPPSTAPAR
ncbi:MAG: hypothetical protein QM611_11715 [Microbacterium sp.]|uniref:hypothetical protein n=1 Tax=Microbacterium sp. TaxID=51671 RepID=UPI0039E656C4